MTKHSLPQTTLVLLRKDYQILLAMKKRKFGEGKWNGVGGKPEGDESMEQCAVRECFEEIQVMPTLLDHVATLDFFHDAHPDWNQRVLVYEVSEWKGQPTETDEMKPQWFTISDIPYKQMWDDDSFWLPRLLSGEKLFWKFVYNMDQEITEHTAAPL